MNLFKTMLVIIYVYEIKCNKKGIDHHLKPSSYFRLKVENVLQNQNDKLNSNDEFNDNIISILINNAEKLFIDDTDTTISTENENSVLDHALQIDDLESTTKNRPDTTFKFILKYLQNNFNDLEFNKSNETNNQLLNTIKFIEFKTESEPSEDITQEIISSSMNVSAFVEENNVTSVRTCIFCNNIVSEVCTEPSFKLVPSIFCKREDDQCYSQHSPFGIIDRGCFNVNHNLTEFVCACNLCNYISIFEMPYIFSNKRDWIENVIELSRANRFRESIFKDMSCLRCEVNVTAKTGDTIADMNCLEGNITMLPSEVCAIDEICAVKAIRSEGYMWRGCVREPLYNYWWTLCDTDLCNYDSAVSAEDHIHI